MVQAREDDRIDCWVWVGVGRSGPVCSTALSSFAFCSLALSFSLNCICFSASAHLCWCSLGFFHGLLVLKSLNSLSLCQLIYSHSFDNHAFTDNFQTYNCQSSLFPELRPCGYLSVYIPEPQTQQQWISCPPSQTCSFSHIVCLSKWNLLSTTALASLLISSLALPPTNSHHQILPHLPWRQLSSLFFSPPPPMARSG